MVGWSVAGISCPLPIVLVAFKTPSHCFKKIMESHFCSYLRSRSVSVTSKTSTKPFFFLVTSRALRIRMASRSNPERRSTKQKRSNPLAPKSWTCSCMTSSPVTYRYMATSCCINRYTSAGLKLCWKMLHFRAKQRICWITLIVRSVFWTCLCLKTAFLRIFFLDKVSFWPVPFFNLFYFWS